MSFKPWRAAPFAALVLVAGCDTVGDNRSLDPGFGESARYNAALQTIDPEPRVPPGAALPGALGGKGAAAVKRYRTDAVKPVERITTDKASGSSANPG